MPRPRKTRLVRSGPSWPTHPIWLLRLARASGCKVDRIVGSPAFFRFRVDHGMRHCLLPGVRRHSKSVERFRPPSRDRHRGPRLPVEHLVKRQTSETADFFGLSDRGRLVPGLRADVNVIDFDRLRLHKPELVHDMPACGRRFIQRVDGYEATLAAGRRRVRSHHTAVPTRGFLPWRFSDAGPRARRKVRDGSASENLHRSGLPRRKKDWDQGQTCSPDRDRLSNLQRDI